MANSNRNLRSAFVQASYNERMAKILSYELAIISVIGSVSLAWFWGIQWFFWGIILIPVVLAVALSIPVFADLILISLGLIWSLPLLFLGFLGIHACFLGAVVVFVLSLWVHSRGITWFADLSRWG